MVQVVQQTVAQVPPESTSLLAGFGANIGTILLVLIVAGLGFGIYFVIKNWNEERKERDDPIYQNYKNVLRACNLQKDNSRIRVSYSLWNLLWFGIPFKKIEQSNKIVDYSNNLIGYYRGHIKTQDGSLNLVVYKYKSWLGLVEDIFVIKCPLKLKIRVPLTEKDPGFGKTDFRIEVVDLKHQIRILSNKDFRINCANLEKLSYWYIPAYISEDEAILDLRSYVNGDFVEMSSSEMVSRVLSTGHKNVEKAMLHNPELKFQQLAPEKTKHEEE
jgi:hypothetical protein